MRKSPFNKKLLAVSILAGSVQLLPGSPVISEAGASQLEEIVVTARKREESLQDVPITVNVVSGKMLDRLAVDGLEDLSTMVPGLMAAETTGSSGGKVVLRGVGSAEQSSLMEQAVSINIDGVPVNDARLMHMGMLDMSQIEVMKGPQALFWGKNSPGGVIAIHTAEPTDEFEGKVTGSYEPYGEEYTGTLMLSGPLSETLKGRLLLSYSESDGIFDVIGSDDPVFVNGTQVAFPLSKLDSHKDEEKLYGRGTLVWEPTENFVGKFKFTYSDIERVGGEFLAGQRVFCPFGAPQAVVKVDNCKADDTIYTGGLATDLAALNPYYQSKYPDGTTQTEIMLGVLDLSYTLDDYGLTFSSVTGYYEADQFWQGDATFEPATNLLNTNTPYAESWTQELRLSSDWDNGFNFTTGLFFEERESRQDGLSTQVRIPAFIGVIPAGIGLNATDVYTQDTSTWSVFAQVSYDITDKLNISGGARYSEDTKELDRTVSGVDIVLADDELTWENLSPEVSLNYTFNEHISGFVSYREGFKSGGFDGAFDASLPARSPGVDISYDEETVDGFEAGLKTNWLDDSLRFNVSVFTYDYEGLQVGIFDPQTTALRILNAGAAEYEGIEGELIWATDIEGLTLTANVNYLDAKYKDFQAPCYTGQTPALGCNLDQANGRFNAQDRDGEEVEFAPELTAAFGFVYEQPVFSGWNISLSSHATYSDAYSTDIEAKPGSRMDSFWLLNAAVSFYSDDDRWEVFVKGNNLTDEYWWMRTFSNPLTGGTFGTGTASDVLADVGGTVSGGRTVTMGVSYSF